MRRFFRFSIRDLLWLTLVVALGLGWFVHQRQLRAEADKELRRANWWHMAAEALEEALKDADWKVEWDFDASRLTVRWTDEGRRLRVQPTEKVFDIQ